MVQDFRRFFKAALGDSYTPYPFQSKLASDQWPHIVEIPTGLGKTAAIVLSWMYKRLHNDPTTPRRLVYCLPMRVLVEQTANNIATWIERLSESGILPEAWDLTVYSLKGGEIENDWDRYPENNAIVVGTQDQLLSRALNRGYSMSRFRWPIDFGFLNNDCLWVMDEVQLMGVGLATTAQLQAFRQNLGTFTPVHSVWMSATLQKEWLNTVDFKPHSGGLRELKLTTEDRQQPSVSKRIKAKKPLQKIAADDNAPGKLAGEILKAHRDGTRTLVVVNTVKRAVNIYNLLKKKKPKAQLSLLHSRFRPADREKALKKVFAEPTGNGSICISTQVVEAGVDISATTLLTDLAPWSSLVQRFGRCNRYGDDGKAQVYWVELDTNNKGSELPYTEQALVESASILESLNDVGSGNLPPVSSQESFKHVIRKKDLIDLFDTTPDLSGMDIDISRFIRESDDIDVHVFWRDFGAQEPDTDVRSPAHNELCSVPIRSIRALNGITPLSWDHLDKVWSRPASINPGMTLMMAVSDGCYDPEIGWTGDKSDIPELIEPNTKVSEGDDDDLYVTGKWQTLSDHTNEVVSSLMNILKSCTFDGDGIRDALIDAAHWHDVGKIHEVFQSAVLKDCPADVDKSTHWAKTSNNNIRYSRRGFRHELASAIAMIVNGLSDLSAYLAAAHHGKVRLSIRSLPHESLPNNPDIRFARGVWEGDVLPETVLEGGHKVPETIMDLSYMEFGDGPKGPSWTSRMIALRDDKNLGPFRLSYLEGLLRAADWRASAKAGD
ncbi:CRISPR-associated helicase Cas3' [uncultured Desulfosarcina sp.]|uniref:type I-G CRISPR-associated helicase/endonuclease Cas3g n=1 Tax=uncultured Desulfosarcina sp. TaxID=218289 RepID=UPI0029C81A60|nr:CRISPR-associated helicase Cas3' [uncultured Desulfosarcina sp.]